MLRWSFSSRKHSMNSICAWRLKHLLAETKRQNFIIWCISICSHISQMQSRNVHLMHNNTIGPPVSLMFNFTCFMQKFGRFNLFLSDIPWIYDLCMSLSNGVIPAGHGHLWNMPFFSNSAIQQFADRLRVKYKHVDLNQYRIHINIWSTMNIIFT